METPSEEIIHLDFEAYPPADDDIPGIVMLLKQLFGGSVPLNLGQLAETFVAQNYVGCVLKVESLLPAESEEEAMDEADPETVYAFTSVLNLTSKKDVGCVSQLKTYLKEKAEGTPAKTRFTDLLDDTGSASPNVGLIINERFVNLPSDANAPMLDSLLSDMKACCIKGMPYKFSHYVIVSKMYRLIDPPNTMHYVYPEDALWSELQPENVLTTFDYQMPEDMDTILVDRGDKKKPDTATHWRRVRVVSADGLLKLIKIFASQSK